MTSNKATQLDLDLYFTRKLNMDLTKEKTLKCCIASVDRFIGQTASAKSFLKKERSQAKIGRVYFINSNFDAVFLHLEGEAKYSLTNIDERFMKIKSWEI